MGFRELLGNEEREISHLKGIGILAGQGGYFSIGKIENLLHQNKPNKSVFVVFKFRPKFSAV